MENESPQLQVLLGELEKKVKLAAMIAPSFPVDFTYPEIVGQLRRLGFSIVTEVSRGAIETNNQLLEILKNNPSARYITSPCPTIVRLIRNQYPHLIKYLSPIKSPMANTVEIIRKKFPGYRPVFIGPCIAKKMEASEDYSHLNIIVITYKELQQLFKKFDIVPEKRDFFESFDLIGSNSRLYGISGGLTQSAELVSFLTNEELDVVSGTANVIKALEDFPDNRLRVLDILNCDGGCISGPGVISINDPLEKRRGKVIAHWAKINR